VDVLTVGEAFQDLVFAGLPRLPRPGEELRVPTFSTSIGGGAPISACAMARLGLRVGTMTAISASGAAELRREGIALINVQRERERGAVSVALSIPHERSFVTYDGVNAVLEPRLLAKLRSGRHRARHVHFALSPRRCHAWLPVVRRIQRHGASTSWDFGWNDQLLKDPFFPSLLNEVSWLFLNEQEARLYSRTRSATAARAHWAKRMGGTVIKRGVNGAVLLCNGEAISLRANRARVRDSTGAGDAFNGAFLAALMRGAAPTGALRVAMYVGARSTEALGGVAGLPVLADLPRLARKQLGAG